MLEQVLAITVGLADTIMVSSCGEAAVSGVSLVDMINVLIINIFAALATGGAEDALFCLASEVESPQNVIFSCMQPQWDAAALDDKEQCFLQLFVHNAAHFVQLFVVVLAQLAQIAVHGGAFPPACPVC